MALAGDSLLVTPGSGATIATELIGGKEHQVMIAAEGSTGHLQGSIPSYIYMSPTVAVGASKLYYDIFNASGSGKIVHLRGIWIIPKTDVAIANNVSARIDLYRTSAVGTSGTAAAYKSATPQHLQN